jgi:hypothetical protein
MIRAQKRGYIDTEADAAQGAESVRYHFGAFSNLGYGLADGSKSRSLNEQSFAANQVAANESATAEAIHPSIDILSYSPPTRVPRALSPRGSKIHFTFTTACVDRSPSRSAFARTAPSDAIALDGAWSEAS